ncbi:MAG: Ig-like domain-containing protein [Proteobacteria bacterium]|nr:Ig-like domain-containing protein [Pseudomonadota bacterium]MBU1715095.1 Ig-like domain-containing protein [Pseudomonadota bacterium]
MKLKTIIVVILTLLISGCGGSSRDHSTTLPDDDTPPIDNPESGEPLAIVSYYPDSNEQDVYAADLQLEGIYVIFNEAVDGVQLTSLTAVLTDDTSGVQPVSGTITYIPEERKGKFIPDSPLAANFYYTATIAGEMIDSEGNLQSEEFSWQFQIAGATPPAPPL